MLQFRQQAKNMVDWICDYYAGLEQLPVRSEVQPGYLRPLLPTHAPQAPEGFAAIMRDVQDKIMPGEQRQAPLVRGLGWAMLSSPKWLTCR